MVNRALLAIMGILVSHGQVHAHQLKVFAHAKQDRITGEVYFAGGRKLGDALVSLEELSSNDEIATTRTSADGTFSFSIDVRQGYRVNANSGDGHIAHWDVQKSEIILSESRPGALQTPNNTPSSPRCEPTRDNLEALIETAVSNQVTPLRAELQEIRDEQGIQDIIGGVGYIAGLAGLGMFWHTRRRES